ncbi:hypothetical protein WEH80_06025 [Actinomycetes bacterium KLBMP 9759]
MDEQSAWLQQLPADTQEHARRLLDALARLGCHDPEVWARSEIQEDIPQLARYRFLKSLWPDLIDDWQAGAAQLPAAQRALLAGADEHDLTQLARAVAYETVFAMLLHIGDGPSDDERLPGWAVSEIDPDGEPTGRLLRGLHEDLLGLDPSGREGQDLWS